jgi:hypothetical protein
LPTYRPCGTRGVHRRCCLCLLFTFFFLGSSARERGRASEARGKLRKHVFLGSSNMMGSLMRSMSSAITPGSNHRCRPSQVLHAPYRCVPELQWRPRQVPFEQRLGGAQHRRRGRVHGPELRKRGVDVAVASHAIRRRFAAATVRRSPAGRGADSTTGMLRVGTQRRAAGIFRSRRKQPVR